jgi:hypothetical protein
MFPSLWRQRLDNLLTAIINGACCSSFDKIEPICEYFIVAAEIKLKLIRVYACPIAPHALTLDLFLHFHDRSVTPEKWQVPLRCKSIDKLVKQSP